MALHRGKAYGQDLRDRVLSAQGSIAQIAQRFEVSTSYVARARARRRPLGQDCPGVQCNHMPLLLAGIEKQLLAQVQTAPDQTLAQLRDWALREHNVRVGITTMWKTLKRFGLSLKKRPCMPANKSALT